jgi:5-methylcytosine-specific restriction endonuclease McrA
MTATEFKRSRVSGQPVNDDALLADLKRVATVLEARTVSQPKYRGLGLYDDTTISRRFGSWNKALLRADLELSNEVNLSEERLFENILALWQAYGRQPRRIELAQPPSRISQSPYNRKFGSWSAALDAFVEYANSTGIETKEDTQPAHGCLATGRDPSLRLRWRVMQRDRFTCCACGASPALKLGVELHVDHIVPWSKGGQTVIENLQTLCAACNLSKSNVHEG